MCCGLGFGSVGAVSNFETKGLKITVYEATEEQRAWLSPAYERLRALTPEALRDFAEWVAAFQREAIAQTLITMPDGVWAKHCADAVRTMRAEH